MRRPDEIATRAGTDLTPRRTRITRTIPTSVQPRRPTMRTARGWLRDVLTPAPALDYLARDERCLIHTRLHWFAPLRAMFRAGVGMAIATAVVALLILAAPGALLPQLVLGVATLAHSVWIFSCAVKWRVERVVVTDRRIIRVSGVLTLTADSVQLDQVTDLNLRRTLAGRVLGYGTVRIESAGQRQGLETLDYVPGAPAVYRALTQALNAP